MKDAWGGQQFQIKVRAPTFLLIFRSCMKFLFIFTGNILWVRKCPLNYLDLCPSKMVNKVWVHSPYIFSTHVFLMFVLGSTYNYSSLKYKCPFKMRQQIRDIYLTRLMRWECGWQVAIVTRSSSTQPFVEDNQCAHGHEVKVMNSMQVTFQ
jgi:hypothetical protein